MFKLYLKVIIISYLHTGTVYEHAYVPIMFRLELNFPVCWYTRNNINPQCTYMYVPVLLCSHTLSKVRRGASRWDLHCSYTAVTVKSSPCCQYYISILLTHK